MKNSLILAGVRIRSTAFRIKIMLIYVGCKALISLLKIVAGNTRITREACFRTTVLSVGLKLKADRFFIECGNILEGIKKNE